MDWHDEGLVIATRPHGEGSVILEAFTAQHGRHAGVVRGGGSRRWLPLLQPGARVELAWSARLEAHIGHFRVDPVETSLAAILGDRAALAALGSVVALLLQALPERATHPVLYARTRDLVAALGRAEDWPQRYAEWELALLQELGFGLDLSTCAVTGGGEDLVWVSPKSGRAVSRAGAIGWEHRLLHLPGFLRGEGRAGPGDVMAALRLSEHFLEAWLAPALPRQVLPAARDRAATALARKFAASSA